MLSTDAPERQYRFRYCDPEAPRGIDFFAGGGGGTLGMKEGGINVVGALNHDETAIRTHAQNFPETEHHLADIFKKCSEDLPAARIGWFSPSCVFHSIARGGRSCNEQERAHAEQMPRFCYGLNLELVYVENVWEFIKWGPLVPKRDKQGNIVREWNKQTQEWDIPMVPDKTRQGEYYRDWLQAMKSMGYTNYEFRKINAADYGTPQSRERYFGIFTRGMPITWPEPTHDQHGRYGRAKWRGVRECLQLHKKGRSIFNRTKTSKKKGTRPAPLAENTLKRILAGLQKLVEGAVGKEGGFLTHYYSGGQLSALGAPCPALLTNPHARLIQVQRFPKQFLYQNNGTRDNDRASRSVHLLKWPTRTVTANGGNQFLMTYYRHGGIRLLGQPGATVTTKDRLAKVEASGFLFNQQFSNGPRSLEAVARTVVASRRHPYLAQVSCLGAGLMEPLATDSAVMLELKAYCRQHGITNVFMRMLFVDELKLVMGFPADYHLLGTETEQKKMLGNAVVPAVAAALTRAMLPALHAWRNRRLRPLRKTEILRYEQGTLFQQAA
jgi:DNA (cytosine-5)-methyltransferase 1